MIEDDGFVEGGAKILGIIFLVVGIIIAPFAINAHLITAKNFAENPDKYWNFYVMSFSFLSLPFMLIGLTGYLILSDFKKSKLIPIYNSDGVIIGGKNN